MEGEEGIAVKQLNSITPDLAFELQNIFRNGLQHLSSKYAYVKKFVNACLKNDLKQIEENYVTNKDNTIFIALQGTTLVG